MRSKPTGRRAAAPGTSSARAAFVPRSNHSPLPGHRWAAAPVPAAAGTSPWVRNGSLALAVTGIVAAVALSQIQPPTADGTTQAQNVGESPTASTAANVTFHSDWLTTDAVIHGYLDGEEVHGGSGDGLFTSKASTGEALFASNDGTVINGNSGAGNIVDADGSGSVVASGAAGNAPAAGSLKAAGESTAEFQSTQRPVGDSTTQAALDSAEAPAPEPAEPGGPVSSDESDGEAIEALSSTSGDASAPASGSETQTETTPAPASAKGDGTTAAAAPSDSAATTPAAAPTESGETSQATAPAEGAGTSQAPTAEPTRPSPEPTSPEPTRPSPEPTGPSPAPTTSSPSPAPTTTSTPEPSSTSLKTVEPSPEPTTSSPESTDGTDRDGWNGYNGDGWSDGDSAGWDDRDETNPDDRGGQD